VGLPVWKGQCPEATEPYKHISPVQLRGAWMLAVMPAPMCRSEESCVMEREARVVHMHHSKGLSRKVRGKSSFAIQPVLYAASRKANKGKKEKKMWY